MASARSACGFTVALTEALLCAPFESVCGAETIAVSETPLSDVAVIGAEIVPLLPLPRLAAVQVCVVPLPLQENVPLVGVDEKLPPLAVSVTETLVAEFGPAFDTDQRH